jgi:hypothetical protein
MANTMNCGAALYFDPQTDAAIRGVWQQIDDAGLPSNMLKFNYPPHMTVLTCEEADIDGLRPLLVDFIASYPPVPVRFHSVATFNAEGGIIYLAPVTDLPLLNLHASLWELISPHTRNSNLLYAPGYWVPHITMNMEVPEEKIGAVMDALLRADLPREGLFTALFIADFMPDSSGLQELFKERLGSRNG